MAKESTTDYKKLNDELDEIMNELQSSDADIDKSMALYERGTQIISQLQAYLKNSENKVNKIKTNWKVK